jgi:hypothetical protein
MYITRFQEGGYRPLAEFGEDIDLTTGSVPGVTLQGDSLGTWREAVLPYRSRGDDQRDNGVWLGWNSRVAGSDTTKRGRPASYTIALSDSLRGAYAPTRDGAVYLSLAATKDRPGPRSAPRDTTRRDTTRAGRARADSIRADSIRRARAAPKPPPPPKTPPEDTIPIDLSVELTDASGRTATLPLSRFGTIRRPLETRIYRREGRDESRFATIFELVPQTYVLPLAEFAAAAPGFSAEGLTRIRLVFDRAVAGTVVLTGAGISARVDAAFLEGRVPYQTTGR